MVKARPDYIRFSLTDDRTGSTPIDRESRGLENRFHGEPDRASDRRE